MKKDTKFKPGESGNPDGRPKGSKDKRTQYRELFQQKAPELIQKAIDLALEGDTTCLKMSIDRIVSPYRAKDPAIQISGLGESLSEKGDAVISAMAVGDITPGEAANVLSAIASQAKILELEELEGRISKLEELEAART